MEQVHGVDVSWMTHGASKGMFPNRHLPSLTSPQNAHRVALFDTIDKGLELTR
jgi:hypothetical protein